MDRSSCSVIKSDEEEYLEPIEEGTLETDSMVFNRHLRYEAATLKQLMKLEGMFREHYELMKKECHQQKDIAERMWFLSQRYAMLRSTSANCCRYPEVYNLPAEDTVLSEFSSKVVLLRESNAIMLHSLSEVREEYKIFEALFDKLNPSFVTDFMVGDSFHKPISFFYELVRDLFNYMHVSILKWKVLVSSMDPLCFTTIADYKKLLEPSFDFEEYLKKGFVYCKCLQPRSVCIVKRTMLQSENSFCSSQND